MDFGLLALIIVAGGKVADYVAPRTKNKWDDRIRDGIQWALRLLPIVNKRMGDAVDKAGKEPPQEVARKVEGFGTARDHRK